MRARVRNGHELSESNTKSIHLFFQTLHSISFCFVFCSVPFSVAFRLCSSLVALFGFPFRSVSPEFSYRPGLSALSEDVSAQAANNASSGQPSSVANNATPPHSAGGPPNRPLPPTPDDDDQLGDRTLIMKRVSRSKWRIAHRADGCVQLGQIGWNFVCAPTNQMLSMFG